MQEVVAQLLDEVRGAARFRWVAFAAAWAVCLAGWTAVMVIPAKYEARARVFVDTRTALSPVIQGLAIQQDVGAHLNLAQETLTSRAQLERIARETGMDLSAATPDERAKMLAKLREGISMRLDFTGTERNPGGVVYTIQYRDPSRDRSLRVVEMLLDSFVEDTLGGKRESSETARAFLSREIAETEQRLRDAEQRLAAFKKDNVGVMPGVEGDYFTRLQNEMDQLRKVRSDLSVAISRRQELESQLRGESPFLVVGGAGAEGRPGGSDTSSQIADAERRLSALLLRYTDKHPDVQAVREEIAALKLRRETELEALRRGDAGAALSSGAGTNPVYQSIQLALNTADVRIAELRGEARQHEQKISDLQRLVETVPEVEAEFARLNRDYEVTRAQYTALVERLQGAELGQEAEKTSAVRFEVIDPPNASFQPVSPKRPLLVAAVFVAALGAAGALAWLLNRFKPVFGRSRELYEATGLPILGEVCLTTIERNLAAERRSYLLLGGGMAALLLAFAVVLRLSFTRSFTL
jgi:polysaccharide chain length determinant protein (PEP-CTERM system associated)